MQMYWWRPELLRNYRSGWLVAIAKDPVEARERVREGMMAWVQENRSWWLLLDEREELEEAKLALEKDIAAEPLSSAALWISGSE